MTIKTIFLIMLPAIGLICVLNSCQSGSTTTAHSTQSESSVSKDSASSAPTEGTAQAIITQYLSAQPQANLYQLDSMRIMNVDTHWQVLVPRTDWAGRMPNAAAFNVDKLTGEVAPLTVK